MKIAKELIKLLLVVFIFCAGIADAREIKFVHITDVNLNKNNAKKLSETVKEINQYKDIDFVVFGGNNISKTNIENFQL